MANKDTMIPKATLKLRKIGRKYMLVETSVNLTNVYSLNETAAWLWEKVCEGEGTPGILAEELCRVYEVEYERALYDVECQLNEWRRMGLI